MSSSQLEQLTSKELSTEQIQKLQRCVAELGDQWGTTVAAWLIRAMCAELLTNRLGHETRAVQEPSGVPVAPDLWRAASHLLSHWDAHRKCFELCGTAVSELQEAFAASAAPGHPEPPALNGTER